MYDSVSLISLVAHWSSDCRTAGGNPHGKERTCQLHTERVRTTQNPGPSRLRGPRAIRTGYNQISIHIYGLIFERQINKEMQMKSTWNEDDEDGEDDEDDEDDKPQLTSVV